MYIKHLKLRPQSGVPMGYKNVETTHKFHNETEFKNWYYAPNKIIAMKLNFTQYLDFILKSCKEFKHIWYKDYIIYKLENDK